MASLIQTDENSFSWNPDKTDGFLMVLLLKLKILITWIHAFPSDLSVHFDDVLKAFFHYGSSPERIDFISFGGCFETGSGGSGSHKNQPRLRFSAEPSAEGRATATSNGRENCKKQDRS